MKKLKLKINREDVGKEFILDMDQKSSMKVKLKKYGVTGQFSLVETPFGNIFEVSNERLTKLEN